jgi:hypothetical protein
MSRWAKFVEVTQNIINTTAVGDLSTVPPEYVENKTDKDITYGVSLKPEYIPDLDPETPKMTLKTLPPGGKMSDFGDVKDVECIIHNDGVRVKISGKPGYLAQKLDIINDLDCKYRVGNESEGINERCEIVDEHKFFETHNEWEPIFRELPFDRACTVEPPVGRDFDTCRIDSPSSDPDLLFEPVELPGGLFQVGLKSLTHLLHSPNFEGQSPEGWNYPVGFYNRLGYDGDGYFDNHFMDCHKIPDTGTEPYGIFHFRIRGRVRFGVHAKKTRGSDDAELTIVIWSLTKKEPSVKRYKMPSDIYLECYTDAEVDINDLLRFEIYLPNNANYHLGGAYLLQQMLPGSGVISISTDGRDTDPPFDPHGRPRPHEDPHGFLYKKDHLSTSSIIT